MTCEVAYVEPALVVDLTAAGNVFWDLRVSARSS
jgi:hypothetical protein